MNHLDPQAQSPSPRRLAGQGALLFTGYAAAQGLSLVRNAIIGHTLSRGDFGIAATITLILQIVETLSDLGSDRMIVQAADGDTPEFLAASHAILVLRGMLLAALLLMCGPLLARGFNVAHAAGGFLLIAFVPLLKGFAHLDCRRAQRRFNNLPQISIEVIPQAVALVMTFPVLTYTPNYSAVAGLAIIQALTANVISHVMAQSPYRARFDTGIFWRQIVFGWPILASALPLIAVYQGDRLFIGRFNGMEALAGYSAAFMITMVPGLITAKVGHALMLPLFSECLRRGQTLSRQFAAMTELTVLAATVFFCAFTIAAERLLPLIFGAQYTHLGGVTAILALMWALRMIQAVPGMALMAYGTTKPFVIAGVIRALALPAIFAAGLNGASIVTIAAIGCLFEVFSLVYIAVRIEKSERGLGKALAQRALFLVPAGAAAVIAQRHSANDSATILVMTISAAALIAGAAASTMPFLRARVRR